MQGFLPYPDYRQPHMRWLPPVPEHWREQRAKTFLREIDKRSETGQEELLSVSHLTGVTPRRHKNVTMFKAESYIGSKLCHPGDIIINTLWAWMAALGASRHAGIVSPAYGVYRLRNVEDFNPLYLDYLLRTRPYVAEYTRRSTGIRPSRLRLYPNQFLNIPLLYPPRPEQDQIVHYLRIKDAQIVRFIHTKRTLIARLNEQKLRIIDHAVTGGLNPSAPRKPSGVDWLGDVPEHWKVRKLKFATQQIISGATPKSDVPTYWDGEIVWVTPSDISKTESLQSSQRTLSATGLQSCTASLVPPGSIIITSRAPVGNVAIAKVDLCTNQGCKAIVPDQEIAISQYLFMLMLRMKEQFQSLANGTTFAEISTWTLANVLIALPPLDEQHTIVAHIQSETKILNDAITHTEAQITLMREYRERLIADAVTGQIDLRGWQPGADDAPPDDALVLLADDPSEAGPDDEEPCDDA